jgi:capsular polysaccharide biosynthesis protein
LQLRDYLNVIRKRWWVAVLVAAFAAATAFGYSVLQPKIYESTVTVLGTPAKPDEGLNNTIKAEVRRFPSMLTSSTIAQRIDDRGKFDLGADAIIGKIKPQPFPDNYLLKITVSDTNAQRAARIADAAADIIKEDEIARQVSVPEDTRIFFDKISPAPVPDRPSTPRTTLNTGAALALGLVVGLILIFVIEYFDSSLRTEEDVERQTGLKVIGTIPPWKPGHAIAKNGWPGPVKPAAADASGTFDEKYLETTPEILKDTRTKREQS